jgi:hypothetical protein
MNDKQKVSILLISIFIASSMIAGLLKLADALYEEKRLFKHLSITKKNILFCFAILVSPIWCPILCYGYPIYYFIYGSNSTAHEFIYGSNSGIEDIETPTVEVTTEYIPIATAELIVL